MNTIEQELRIEYIGTHGVGFWHGKLSTLLKRSPYAIILGKETITPEFYDKTG